VAEKPLRIAKALCQVNMWVHPEGLVHGAVYVTIGEDNETTEDPKYVLNEDSPFLVLKRNKPEGLRFYNRSAIVRVEYEEQRPRDTKYTVLPCRATMMDGSVIVGEIIEVLPDDHARLYDYLNRSDTRFIRLFTDTNQVCMVNKSYVIQVSST
jgi:hypothetical protein